MNLHDKTKLARILKLNALTKRDLFALTFMHAIMSIPPGQRPRSAAKAAVAAADKLIEELQCKKP